MSIIGKKLENITLESTAGFEASFPEVLEGKRTLIYFYPKDDTPGCTVQACSYRDNAKVCQDENIQVFGVSKDSLESHNDFSAKFDLNFPLLVDDKGVLAEALEVSGRDSFLIDENAVVVKEWRKVDPKTTVSETLEAALNLV